MEMMKPDAQLGITPRTAWDKTARPGGALGRLRQVGRTVTSSRPAGILKERGRGQRERGKNRQVRKDIILNSGNLRNISQSPRFIRYWSFSL